MARMCRDVFSLQKNGHTKDWHIGCRDTTAMPDTIKFNVLEGEQSFHTLRGIDIEGLSYKVKTHVLLAHL